MSTKGKKNQPMKKGSGFVGAINDKRIMIPIIAVLAAAVICLTVFIILDQTGVLYHGFSIFQNKTVENEVGAIDGTLHKSGDYEYRLLKDGTAEHCFYTDGYAADVTVPSEIDGYKVTSIGNECFVWMAALTTVKIPDGVTYIGESAFEGCQNMTDVRLPSSLKGIGLNAFKGCSSTMRVEFAGSVSSLNIGDGNSALEAAMKSR